MEAAQPHAAAAQRRPEPARRVLEALIRVVSFMQDTAKEFHQFYNQCRVIGEAPDVQASRLALCQATKRVLATALDLVGVEAPEQM
jgi:arginyl-tRNA synthetase